jgi:hypothetical protein
MVDQLLGGLFGATDQDDEPTRRRRAHDFVDRYERGATDQMSDAEIVQNYRAATAKLSPDEYRQVTADALRKMDPQQRRELKRYMRKQGRMDLPDDDDDSPEVIAQAAQKAEQEHQGSGGLLGFLGLGGDKPDSAPATGKPQAQEGGIDAMISNPLVKVAVAGIAAMAAKKLTEPRG